MCWNENVSLNTFLFSGFILALIVYNNTFTKYKIQELNNKWMYLFIASFILMQLIEFFIWRNINNKFYNNIFSIAATLLLIMQPIASIMILTNNKIRDLLLIAYLSIAIPFSIYKFSNKHIQSEISECGHLKWNFFGTTSIVWIVWLFFFLFSFVYEKKWFGLIFGCVALLIAFINYKNDHTAWSMWCWGVNSIMIYYAIYLLIYLPILEKANIC
jgi:uncharacterized membrane protein HdeD (DUF308 family)